MKYSVMCISIALLQHVMISSNVLAQYHPLGNASVNTGNVVDGQRLQSFSRKGGSGNTALLRGAAVPPLDTAWTWAKSSTGGGTGHDDATGVGVDGAGNSYVVGSFNSPTIQFGSTTLTNTGGYQMYIVKYDPNGTVVWAHCTSGGNGGTVAAGIAVDLLGNSYVTGNYSGGTVHFDSDSLTNTAGQDMFIVKYNPRGRVLWARTSTSMNGGFVRGRSVAVDGSGDCYVVGYDYISKLVFGHDTLFGGTMIWRMFIAKYDPDGNVLWAKGNTRGGFNNGGQLWCGVAVDGSGNCLVAGNYSTDSIRFDWSALANSGGFSTTSDVFLLKYDRDGNLVWARSGGGGGDNDIATGVGVDRSGNCYMVGWFLSGGIWFGSTGAVNTSFGGGFADMFIVKYDTNGNDLWTQSAGGINNDYAAGVAVDSSGNSYVTGYYYSATMQFGTTTLSNVDGSAATADLYIAKYGPSSTTAPLWAKSAGNDSTDVGFGVTVDAVGNSCLVGCYSSPTVQFGSATLSNAALGYRDMYVAKIGSAFMTPVFSTDSTHVSFGVVNVGSPKSDSIIVSNNGNGWLVVDSVTSSSTEFAVHPDSAVVGVSAGTKFSVTFNPAGIGVKNGFLLFFHNGLTSPDTVRVNGVGSGPQFSMTPAQLSFGGVPRGSTKHDSLIVKNTGPSQLIVTSVSTNDTELVVSPSGATIAPADSQIFRVTFSPVSSYSSRVDTITFQDNAGGPHTIVCTAVGMLSVVETMQTGWNMISVPVSVNDPGILSVFPTASSSAFAYLNGYQTCDTLHIGQGYWLKFDVPQSVPVLGFPVATETVVVKKGWNMIGSISTPISASSVTSVPGGMDVSVFFGYSDGYSVSDSIVPGKAYWVRANEDGSLILSASGPKSSANRIHIGQTTEEPPPPPEGMVRGSGNQLPKEFALEQNYPNPFNPATIIRYQLPVTACVNLAIYNVLGQRILTLVNVVESAGYKSVEWNASAFPSGIYYYRLQANGFTAVRKLALVR